MDFYEIKFLIRPTTTAGEVDQKAAQAAAATDVELQGVTVHARSSPETTRRYDAAVFVGVADSLVGSEAVESFMGAMVRMHGLAPSNYVSFGEVSLSLKGHSHTEADFVDDALGRNDPADETFYIAINN